MARGTAAAGACGAPQGLHFVAATPLGSLQVPAGAVLEERGVVANPAWPPRSARWPPRPLHLSLGRSSRATSAAGWGKNPAPYGARLAIGLSPLTLPDRIEAAPALRRPRGRASRG